MLPLVTTSPSAGYVTSPGFQAGFDFVYPYDGAAAIAIPANHSVMVSFPTANIAGRLYLTLVQQADQQHDAEKSDHTWYESGDRFIPARVFTSAVSLSLQLTTKGGHGRFKMLYSFHDVLRTPLQLVDGKFNCSTDTYPDFQQYLHCNLAKECEDGRDETGEVATDTNLYASML